MTLLADSLHGSLAFAWLVSVAACGASPNRPAPVAAPKAIPPETASVRLVGGPTAVIELGGARFLTDPTFSPPGAYPVAPGRTLTKLEGPAIATADIGPIDAVLLSHDQHVDNLDPAGRDYVARASRTFTTPMAASRLAGHIIGLAPWKAATLVAHNGREFQITAVPAQHGPDGTEPITGPVAGFLVTSEGLPTVYVSGDNASLDVVREIAARAHVDIAVLFVGAAKSPRLLGDSLLTLDGHGAAAAASILSGAAIVPVHFRGWGHFTQGGEAISAAFAAASLTDRLHLLEPGETVAISSSRER